LRLLLGWTFLWAFLDKLLSLGFATGRNPETGAITFFGPDAWIHGGSPTAGFLQFGTKGPFKDFLAGVATAPWIGWVFMASLLLIGVGLLFGVAARLAAIGGAIWMGLFYLAGSIWPANNPVLDEHIIQLVVLVGIAYVGAGRYLGLGKRWAKLPIVRDHTILQG
jgi:thiosulfate dehydrogenase [quinone] large subunit